MSDQKAVKRILLALAEYFDKSLTESQLAMYSQDLSDLNAFEIERASVIYRKNPKNTRFPLPSALIAALHPEQDESTVAIDLATRLCALIEEKGYVWEFSNGNGVAPAYAPYPTFAEAVIGELGTVALEVVQRFGGWRRIHDAYYDSDRTAFMAQLRDRVAAILKLSRSGHLHYRPSLPLNHDRPSLENRTGPKSIATLTNSYLTKAMKDLA